MTRALFSTFWALAACTPAVPDAPSFQEHVAPILAANCMRCHGYPAIGGAPEDFRLDSFEDLPLSDEPDDLITGVAAMAPLIAERVASSDAPMPPRFGLDDYQIETITNWARTGTRGTPRPNNQPPVVTATVNELVVSVRVDDADDSIVAGQLRLVGPTGDAFVGLVRTGSIVLAIDPALVALPGTYLLVASVDDGAEVHVIEAASFEVLP
jgi:hypothetical protein